MPRIAHKNSNEITIEYLQWLARDHYDTLIEWLYPQVVPRLVDERPDLADWIHDGFVEAAKRIPIALSQATGVAGFVAYLRQGAEWSASSFRRKEILRKQREQNALAKAGLYFGELQADPMAEAQRIEARFKFEDSLWPSVEKALTPTQRRLLAYLFEGLKPRQIAPLINSTGKSCRTKLCKLRKKLSLLVGRAEKATCSETSKG